MITHLTKECKEKLVAGEITIYGLENLEFIQTNPKMHMGSTCRRCIMFMGQTLVHYRGSNDPKLRSCLQGNGCTSRVFWAGSSDLHYMVTKISSSFSGHASLYADYER